MIRYAPINIIFIETTILFNMHAWYWKIIYVDPGTSHYSIWHFIGQYFTSLFSLLDSLYLFRQDICTKCIHFKVFMVLFKHIEQVSYRHEHCSSKNSISSWSLILLS